jgi:hypothetical protein
MHVTAERNIQYVFAKDAYVEVHVGAVHEAKPGYWKSTSVAQILASASSYVSNIYRSWRPHAYEGARIQ